jgi:hypothetical protein
VKYLPVDKRPVATRYLEVLARTLADGEWVATSQGPRARTLMQQTMAFPLDSGFPMITERFLSGFWHSRSANCARSSMGPRRWRNWQRSGVIGGQNGQLLTKRSQRASRQEILALVLTEGHFTPSRLPKGHHLISSNTW